MLFLEDVIEISLGPWRYSIYCYAVSCIYILPYYLGVTLAGIYEGRRKLSSALDYTRYLKAAIVQKYAGRRASI